MMGASTSIMVFSCRRMAAPSLMIFSAASSSRRPSFTRWLFRTSRRGLPSSNTSFSVSLCVGGKGTAAKGRGDVRKTAQIMGKEPQASRQEAPSLLQGKFCSGILKGEKLRCQRE